VFVAAGTSCPVVRLYIPALNALATRWKTKNIRFYLIGAAKHDSFASFRAEFREFNLRFTAAFDEGQLLSSRLAFQSTSQVVVYNVATDEILYRGAIDDRVGIDGEKPAPTHDFLNSVLAAVAANKPPPITSSQAFGCAITY
jgi:hypothetical protein